MPDPPSTTGERYDFISLAISCWSRCRCQSSASSGTAIRGWPPSRRPALRQLEDGVSLISTLSSVGSYRGSFLLQRFSRVTHKAIHGPGEVLQNHRPLLKVLFALPCQAIDAVRGAAFAGQAVDIKEVHDGIWLVSFMDYDWDPSTWRAKCSNRSIIRSAQNCHLCDRYVLSPMSPGRTMRARHFGNSELRNTTPGRRAPRRSGIKSRPSPRDSAIDCDSRVFVAPIRIRFGPGTRSCAASCRLQGRRRAGRLEAS